MQIFQFISLSLPRIFLGSHVFMFSNLNFTYMTFRGPVLSQWLVYLIVHLFQILHNWNAGLQKLTHERAPKTSVTYSKKPAPKTSTRYTKKCAPNTSTRYTKKRAPNTSIRYTKKRAPNTSTRYTKKRAPKTLRLIHQQGTRKTTHLRHQ